MSAIFLWSSDGESESPRSITGQWVYVNDTGRYINDYLGVEFANGDYFSVSRNGRTLIGKYSVIGDSIHLRENGKRRSFKISGSGRDSLILTENGVASRYYNRSLEFDSLLSLKEITISTGPCFGECAQFEVHMDDRNGSFHPLRNCVIVRDTIFSVQKSDWQKLDSLFKWSRITMLDTTARYSLIDDWSMTVNIKYNNDQEAIIKGTLDGLPYRIRPVVKNAVSIIRKRSLIK